MYNKILAPVDGSELSEYGLEHVKAIATGCSVPEVVLLRIIEPIPSSGEIASFAGEEWLRNAEKNAVEGTEDYLNRVKAKLTNEGINVQTVVKNGNAADEIVNYAKKNNVDLIVMGSHGSSGIVRWALGSTTDKVVRHSTAPVLVAVHHSSRR